MNDNDTGTLLLICNICNDSKVTPENQIIICKGCHVPIHQLCYSIQEEEEEEVDDGDYYCMACRHFGRNLQQNLILDKSTTTTTTTTTTTVGNLSSTSQENETLQQADNSDKKTTSTAGANPSSSSSSPPPSLPICCELCPLRDGAFIQTTQQQQTQSSTNDSSTTTNTNDTTKWVHMSCAKWHRLKQIVVVTKTTCHHNHPTDPPGRQRLQRQNDNVVVVKKKLLMEDPTRLKSFFRKNDIHCSICRGKRGAYSKCRVMGCNVWLHMSCARAIGKCEVIYGEDGEGGPTILTDNPWTLMCIDHSSEETIDNNNNMKKMTTTTSRICNNKTPPMMLSQKQLINAANQFPDDIIIPRPIMPLLKLRKPFHELTGKERKDALSHQEYENKVVKGWLYNEFAGARCEVCDVVVGGEKNDDDDDGKNNLLLRCSSCASVICTLCKVTTNDDHDNNNNNNIEVAGDNNRFFTCSGCKIIKEKENETTSAEAAEEEDTTQPQCSICFQKYGLLLPGYTNMNLKVKGKKKKKNTQKTRELWAHYSCALWINNKLKWDAEKEMVDFSNTILSNNGKRLTFPNKRCVLCGLREGHKIICSTPNCRSRFHVTCARQAGLEVNYSEDYEGGFYAHCYAHGGNRFNLRAKIDDLISIERQRVGQEMTSSSLDVPLTSVDASRLVNQSIVLLRIMGWAWRWAEWWVEYGSNWKPLLEPGQKKEDSTKTELKFVDSTKDSRCEDARYCRLAAFGAALRNRNYDTDDGFEMESFDRAIRAILHTPSLVGPLEISEIDFIAEWLGRAYRSKSKLLGFGGDKIPVAKDSVCVHLDDKTPKYELGNRKIPGKQVLGKGQIFESCISEPDNYLKAVIDFGDDEGESSHDSDIEEEEETGGGLLTASMVFTDLKNPDGKLPKGGPPKVCELPVALKVGGDYFDPGDTDQSSEIELSNVDTAEFPGVESVDGEKGDDDERKLPATPPKRKRGRPPKSPRNEDAQRTRGRPPKSPRNKDSQAVTAKLESETNSPMKRKRGRPPKSPRNEDAQPATAKLESAMKRKRGRPPKPVTAKLESGTNSPMKRKRQGIQSDEAQLESPPKRKRGRPPKSSTSPDVGINSAEAHIQDSPDRPKRLSKQNLPLSADQCLQRLKEQHIERRGRPRSRGIRRKEDCAANTASTIRTKAENESFESDIHDDEKIDDGVKKAESESDAAVLAESSVIGTVTRGRKKKEPWSWGWWNK